MSHTQKYTIEKKIRLKKRTRKLLDYDIILCETLFPFRNSKLVIVIGIIYIFCINLSKKKKNILWLYVITAMAKMCEYKCL